MKKKRRPRFWVGMGALAIVVILVVAVIFNLPKPQQVSDSSFDLTTFADGVYQGVCHNGLVSVSVEVDVRGHAITAVRILEHRNGMGKPAEVIVDTVVSSQSVEVDAVSGATMSSGTILKAIENALK